MADIGSSTSTESTTTTTNITRDDTGMTMDLVIKIGLGALLAYWCFDIVKPFISIFVWAAILAVLLYPVYLMCVRWLGGRSGLAATLMTLVLVGALLGPIISLGAMLVQEMAGLLKLANEGAITVPPPPESLISWPLIGNTVHDLWAAAATNLAATLASLETEIKAMIQTLLSAMLGAGMSSLQFIASLAIAGFLVTKAEASHSAVLQIAEKLLAGNGAPQVKMIEQTVRNVSRGVIGTALIQTFFVGIGLFVAGIPGAAIWTVLSLVLSIIQIGPAPIVIGSAIYMGMQASTMSTVLFLVYMVPVMLVDNVLKPILMGKGSELPVVLILIGVIGGTIGYGLVGVFIGPVILAIGYTCFQIWLDEPGTQSEPAPSPQAEET